MHQRPLGHVPGAEEEPREEDGVEDELLGGSSGRGLSSYRGGVCWVEDRRCDLCISRETTKIKRMLQLSSIQDTLLGPQGVHNREVPLHS